MSSPPPWGCPWHGRVQGGQLTLPNGEQLAWPQPDGTRRLEFPTNRYAWRTHNAGMTHLVQMPDAPPVERSTEELAEDAAAGRTWLNKALLVGSGNGANPESYLHGHAVDGWVYAAPDGSRWMARALGEYSWDGAGIFIPMTVRRFGVLGGRPVAYNAYLQLSLAGMGQPAGATGQAKVEAIRPDGAQAIVRLYFESASGGDSVGFLLISLIGTPGVAGFAATLTVLHSRADTLGALEINNAATDGSTKVQLVINTSESQEDHRSGAPPSCTGYLDTIKTYSSSLVGVPMSEPVGYIVASGTNTVRRTGAIVAAWFNAAGEIEEVRLDIEKTRVVSLPAPNISYSGRDVFRQSNINGDGVCVLSGMSQIERFTTTRSRTSTYTQTVLIRLRVGEHQVEVSGSETETVTASYSGTGGTQTSELDRDISGTTFGWPSADHWHYSGGTSGTEGVEFYPFSAADAQLSVGYNPVGTGGYNVALKRWSNNLFGLMTRKPRGYGSTLDSINWSPALSPAGVVPGVSEDVAVADDVSPWDTRRPFGSFNPLTGEAVIASADPISWT